MFAKSIEIYLKKPFYPRQFMLKKLGDEIEIYFWKSGLTI
jgi:hypothetical protein